jgi:hypothetical protein
MPSQGPHFSNLLKNRTWSTFTTCSGPRKAVTLEAYPTFFDRLLDAIDAERRSLWTRRKWRTIVNAVMTERAANRHRQLIQDVRSGHVKAVAHVLF